MGFFLGGGFGGQNWLQRLLKWPVEFQISHEWVLSGHIPGVGLDMLDRCYCGFASMCNLMYAGRTLNVFVSAQECMKNLSSSP